MISPRHRLVAVFAALSLALTAACGARGGEDEPAAKGGDAEAATEEAAPAEASATGEQPAEAAAPDAAAALAAGAAPATPATPAAKPAAGSAKKPSSAAAPAPAGGGGGQAPAGGGGGGGATPAAEGGSSAPAPGQAPALPAPGGGGPKREILLGSIGTSSGPIGANVVSSVTGTKAWVADVNLRGGVSGHPVRVIFGDDTGDPQRALAIARKMAEEDKVLAFINFHSPTTLQSVIPYLEQKGMAMLDAEGGSFSADHSPNVFQFHTGSDQGTAWAFMLQGLASGKKKLGVVYCREVQICPGVNNRIKELIGKTGMEFVFEAQVSLAQPDFTAEMIAARNAGAESLVMLLDFASVIRLIRAGQRQGYKPVILSYLSTNTDEFLAKGGQDVEGVLTAATTANFATSPKLKDMRDAVARFVPGQPRGSFTAQSWVSGKWFERIFPLLPDPPTPQSVVETMYQVKNEDLGGLTPKLTFNRGDHTGVNLCVVRLIVKGNKFVATDGEDVFTCAPGYVAGDPETSHRQANTP